jgi:hypothetical protein
MASWPLTPSRVWPPLATTRYHRLALTSDSELVSQSSNWLSLLCTDRTENTACNISSIVAYLLRRSRDLDAVETCLQSYCLATDVFSGFTILVWALMSQYVSNRRYKTDLQVLVSKISIRALCETSDEFNLNFM